MTKRYSFDSTRSTVEEPKVDEQPESTADEKDQTEEDESEEKTYTAKKERIIVLAVYGAILTGYLFWRAAKRRTKREQLERKAEVDRRLKTIELSIEYLKANVTGNTKQLEAHAEEATRFYRDIRVLERKVEEQAEDQE